MEYHRIQEMPKNYDPKVFNKIYAETRHLTYNLAKNIDPRIFGHSCEKQDIVSFFDSKFMHIFNKYYGNFSHDVLKGHIISGLQRYRNRILRSSYARKNEINRSTIDIMEVYNIESKEIIEIESDSEESFSKVIPLFKDRLSKLSFHVFCIDYSPPLYILIRIQGDKIPSKIPDDLICEFLSLDNTPKTHRLIYKARKEYRDSIKKMGLS